MSGVAKHPASTEPVPTFTVDGKLDWRAIQRMRAQFVRGSAVR
jgi:hypothetical protein